MWNIGPTLLRYIHIMQSILSHSIPLKEVINDLARQMHTSVETHCDEYSLIIPESFGSGKIKALDFKSGLGLILYDCTFKEDMEIRFIINRVHPLKFIFCETGNLNHRFEDEVVIHNLDNLQNLIVASCQEHGHILQFKGGIKTIMNSLEVNRKEFIVNMECELKSLEPELEALFRDTKAVNVFFHQGNYCLKMADLFIEINGFPKEEFLRKLFFESIANKILTLQILQYQDDMDFDGSRPVLRKFEILLIQRATSIIDNEILDFKNVPHLAAEVGLNSNKLQQGFRELHGTTVNGYMQDKRLELANTLLRKSDLSISEIVYKVGLSSKSYFSKIFKEKYGISPSSLPRNTTSLN